MKKSYKTTNRYKTKKNKKTRRYKKSRRYKPKKIKKTVRGGMFRLGSIIISPTAKEIAIGVFEEKLKRTKTHRDVEEGLANTIQELANLANNNENVDPNKKPINMNSFSPEDNSPFVPKKVFKTGSLKPVKTKLFSTTEI
jgi:hypothetical protein